MAAAVAKKMIFGLSGGQIQEVDDNDVDYELPNADSLMGSHVNLIPMQGAVQAPRLFYGARFYNQALPVVNREQPLVQNLMSGRDDDRSYDESLGSFAGAVRSDDDGDVIDVQPTRIVMKMADGTDKVIPLYKNFPFNRKSAKTNFAKVKVGDRVTKGQLLASSNYTDDNGVLAMGLNARIALIPYKGWGMDDATVISESFGKRLASEQSYTLEQDFDDNTKGGRNHFISLFPTTFEKKQMGHIDEDGVAKVGSILKKGDPYVLATAPKIVTSQDANVGKLSRTLQQTRKNASQTWDYDDEGEVVDVVKNKGGVKVIVRSVSPTKKGDKITMRSGQKNIVSKIVPDDQMPRTVDGQPIDVLLNQLSIPSRVNDSLPYELMLGKVARKLGKPIKIPAFNKPDERWYDMVKARLDEAGLTDTEEIFDPMSNRKLENPVTVGFGYVQKLHHTSECYDDQTEVLTRRGWIAWPEVHAGDHMFTVDAESGSTFYEQPSRVVSYDVDESLLGFESPKVDWLTTANHEHWIKRKTQWKKQTSASIADSKFFSVKQFGFKALPGKSPKFIRIEPPKFATNKRRRSKAGGSRIRTRDYAELLGWWLAEGSVIFDEAANCYRVHISQSSVANPENCAEIEALLSRLPYAWKTHRLGRHESQGYYIDDAGLAQHIAENCGVGHLNKTVPRALFELNTEHRELLVDTIIKGDGGTYIYPPTGASRKSQTVRRFFSTSRKLASDVQELCCLLGFSARMQTHPAVNERCQPQFWLTINKTPSDATIVSNTHGRKARAVTVPYRGKVYCATVSTGMLYVRRNGKPLWSGNSKKSSRGIASYDQDQQPARGGGAGAQAKRLSGLETNAFLSAGAYHTLKEGSTLRGQQSDEYWRQLRMGHKPPPPGEPFVWTKFMALLSGAGLHARKLGKDRLRIGPMTDAVLDAQKPVEIKNGEIVNLGTLEPVAGGLFDPALVGGNRWGKVALPTVLPNPAMADSIRALLGLTKKQFEDVIAGRLDLD